MTEPITDQQTQAPGPKTAQPVRFPITVAEWPRNDREIVRIALERFKDRYTIDIRVWWRDVTGIFKPSRDGLKLAISHTPKLAEGFDKACQCAEAFGLVSQPRRSRVAARRPSNGTDIGRHTRRR